MIGSHRSNPFSKEEHSGNLSTPSIDKGKKKSSIRLRDSILTELSHCSILISYKHNVLKYFHSHNNGTVLHVYSQSVRPHPF